MNAVTDLLSRVRSHGAELVPADTAYRVSIHSPTEIPRELMAKLRKHKPEILNYLRTCSYYRYRLRGSAGGIYRTRTRCLEAARAELVEIYDDKLIVVAHA